MVLWKGFYKFHTHVQNCSAEQISVSCEYVDWGARWNKRHEHCLDLAITLKKIDASWAKMGDSDSGIGVGTSSKFDQFGTGVGSGINFFSQLESERNRNQNNGPESEPELCIMESNCQDPIHYWNRNQNRNWGQNSWNRNRNRNRSHVII